MDTPTGIHESCVIYILQPERHPFYPRGRGEKKGERGFQEDQERGKRWENKSSESVSRDWQGEAIGGVQIFIDKVKASDDAVCSSTGRYGNTSDRTLPETAMLTQGL